MSEQQPRDELDNAETIFRTLIRCFHWLSANDILPSRRLAEMMKEIGNAMPLADARKGELVDMATDDLRMTYEKLGEKENEQ